MAGNYSNTGSWVPTVHSVGLRNVGSYEVAGTPWLSSSGGIPDHAAWRCQFPYVTKSIMIQNIKTSGDNYLLVCFDKPVTGDLIDSEGFYGNNATHDAQTAGLSDVVNNGHFIKIFNRHRETIKLEVKCKEIWVMGADGVNNAQAQVYAELTNIPTSSMFTLTGSGISE